MCRRWFLGLVTMVLIPLIMQHFGIQDRTAWIAGMGWSNIAALAVGLPILMLWFRERPVPVKPRGLGLGTALKLLATDGTVLRVIGSDFFVSLGQGFRGALVASFVVYTMKLDPRAMLVIPLVQYGFGVLASPIWGAVGRRLGKRQTLILGEAAQIVVNLALLGLAPGQYWALVVLTATQGLCQGSGNLMLRAIISDVADQERLKTGKDHSGLLFSIFNVTINAAFALSVGIALPLVGMFGFNPSGQNTPAALSSLQWIIAVGPAIGHTLSAILMITFPLDEERIGKFYRNLRCRLTPCHQAIDLPPQPAAGT